MTVRNEAPFLRQSIESLLAQDFEDFELLISDNASQDATQAICAESMKRDKRIHYYRNDRDLGQVGNFNSVFHRSVGKYFMWASGNDLWDPTFLSKCRAILDQDREVVISYPLVTLIDLQGTLLLPVQSRLDTRGLDQLTRFNHVIWFIGSLPIYGLMRSAALRQTRLMRDTLIAPDKVLLAEMALLGSFALVGENLFFWRVHNPCLDVKRESRRDFLKGQFRRLLDTRRAKIRFPYWRYVCEMLNAVNIVETTRKEKIELYLSALFHSFLKNKGYLIRDLFLRF